MKHATNYKNSNNKITGNWLKEAKELQHQALTYCFSCLALRGASKDPLDSTGPQTQPPACSVNSPAQIPVPQKCGVETPSGTGVTKDHKKVHNALSKNNVCVLISKHLAGTSSLHCRVPQAV